MNPTVNTFISINLALYINAVLFFRSAVDTLSSFVLKAQQDDSCDDVGCETFAIESATDEKCNKLGGTQCMYYVCTADVDWEATCAFVNTTYPNYNLSAFAMIGGAVFSPIRFSKKTGSYTFTYSNDSRTYTNIVDMIIEGKNESTTAALCNLIQQCNFTAVIFDRNCKARITGRDFINGGFQDYVEPFEIGGHTDSSGTFDGDTPGDTLQFTGESEKPPLCYTGSKADFENLYT